ncbi:MAG: radical SAM protein [Acidobacteriaceae bacterium]
MKDIYLLPPRYRTWTREGWHIYFDPQNFAWAKVNDAGKYLLDLCASYFSIEEMVDKVVEDTALLRTTAESLVRKFINDMGEVGILHLNQYTYVERPGFTHLPFPRDIYLHVTDKCNLKCSYCYNRLDRTQKLKLERENQIAPELNTSEMKSLLDQLVSNGARRILFTGGEPLLRKDLLELIRYTRSLSDIRKQHGESAVKIELLTNAILINEQVADELCTYVDTVTISLDGHEPHHHDVSRGKGAFDATVESIRTLVRVRQQRHASIPSICIVPVISTENVGSMKQIYAFALRDLGVNSLSPILFQAGDHQELSLAKVPDRSVFFQAIRDTEDYLIAEGLKPAMQPRATAVARHHCGVGSAEISIDSHGTVYPCQSLHYDNFAGGNIRSSSIRDILAGSPVMQMVRGTTVDRIKMCSHCDMRNLCNGGCRATAYNLYKEFDRTNEFYCATLEQFAVERLWAATGSGSAK